MVIEEIEIMFWKAGLLPGKPGATDKSDHSSTIMVHTKE
jgi:hypothetical protein